MKRKFLKIIFSFCLIALGGINSIAQQIEWALPFNVAEGAQGAPSIKMSSVCSDLYGNVYVSGDFRGVVDFNSGGSEQSETSNGLYDGFIAKYDKNGMLKFMKHISGYLVYVKKIVTDNKGYLYVIGDFNSTTDFDPGDGTATLTPSANKDGFIAKYDTLGNYVYAKAIGDYMENLTIDQSGENIYVIGGYTGGQDFDPGEGVVNLPEYGNKDIFFAKLTVAGDLVYVKGIGGSSDDYWFPIDQKVAVNSNGELYIAGSFSTTMDFDPDDATQILSPSNQSIYLAKYDQSGALITVKWITNTCFSESVDMVMDQEDNLYITGSFCGTLDFDPDGGTTNLETSDSYNDVFFAKYNSSLNLVFAKNFGGPKSDYAYALSIDSLGFINVGGTVFASADFDPSDAVAAFIGAANSTNFFFARYKPDGEYYNHNVMTAGNYVYEMNTDKNGSVYLSGNLSATADFDFSDETHSLTSTGASDGFLAKYTFLPEIRVTKDETIINSGNTFDFGGVQEGQSSSIVSFKIKNEGDWSLKLTDASKVVLSGADASDFFLNLTSLSDLISPRDESSFTVIFIPSSTGDKTATLTILNSDISQNVYSINLNGTGASTTGMMDAFENKIYFYPNPSADGSFMVNSSEQVVETIVINSLGQKEIFSGNQIETQFKGILTVMVRTTHNIYQEKLLVRE